MKIFVQNTNKKLICFYLTITTQSYDKSVITEEGIETVEEKASQREPEYPGHRIGRAKKKKYALEMLKYYGINYTYAGESEKVVFVENRFKLNLETLEYLNKENSNKNTAVICYNEDAEHINAKTFLLGDKKVFLDMAFGEGYSQEVEQDYMGNPLNPPEDADKLLETHIEAFRLRRSESLYMKKNDRVSYFIKEAIDRRGFRSMKERIENENIIFGEVAGANYALSLDLKEIGQEKEENER